MRLDRIVNLGDFRAMARSRLPRIAFDFIDGGVHDEENMRRNREAFRRYAILPRYLVDVSARDQSVELFGRRYSSPFGISPMGLAGLFRPGADLMMASAAHDANIPFVMSSASNDSIEKASAAAPGTTWFQMYGTKDAGITDDLVRRATAARVPVLILTVDTPIIGGRERNVRNGFTRPMRMTPSIILQGLMRPRWTLSYLRMGGFPMMENWAPYLPGGTPDQVADLYARETPAPAQTWKVLERIRGSWSGPLMVKGILHPEDAALAVSIGADGLVVSNHGGRQFDRAPAPLDVLPRIRERVGETVTIAYESGVRRGSDLVIAKCLGADFALIGRPMMFAVAAAGKAGVARALKIMASEIDHTLAQMGSPRFEACRREMVMRLDDPPVRSAVEGMARP
jgi:L-lactate dehydrogenase (cytochrome)/(S)-mandelate dehydrogenase